MGEIINWLRKADPVVFYYESIYSSFEQELQTKFYTQKSFKKRDVDHLLDYWNSGDCVITELKWLPDISSSNPLWLEVAQNFDPDASNYLPLSEQALTLIKNRHQEILSGEIKAFSLTSSDKQYYAFSTGIVEENLRRGNI